MRKLTKAVTPDVLARNEKNGRSDPPPLKWSALRYGFRAKEDHDAEEETQARGDCCEAAPGGCAGVAGAERALPTRYARLGLRRSRTTAGARSLAGSRATRSSD